MAFFFFTGFIEISRCAIVEEPGREAQVVQIVARSKQLVSVVAVKTEESEWFRDSARDVIKKSFRDFGERVESRRERDSWDRLTRLLGRDAAEKPLKDWCAKFEAGLLTSPEMKKFFSENAPLYAELEADGDSVRYVYNESTAKTKIIEPLIEFICGNDPQRLIEKLKSESNAPSVCGKVFRIGEPTYSCRGCGMDSTCVLCVNCFKQSAHRYHKYKMSTSGGGGCCDCGDVEAWKKDPYCEEHIRGMRKPPKNSIITNRMRERCDIAFRAILMYCVKFLEIESHASLECLDGGADEETFCTVLYNDESHTFEQVIQTLIKICKCNQRDAMEFVTSIDREGRAVVKVDSFETCVALKEAIEKQPMRHSTSVIIEEKTLAGHVASCIMYDVASKPVSIHLPLTRFFAGIYLHLGKFGLNFDNATTIQKRTPEEIIEPVLCTQTMIAQKCPMRSEMLDRDIAALQIGAALIESNQYLIHILNKFALLEWADPGYESVCRNYTDDEYMRQLNMIDEFLELLIVIIGERYVPGIGDVTEDDRIKKEIIQLLCIKNFSHSELNLATFKKPQQSNAKGVYELKNEFFDDYNMYFYHYTKEDKSKSEENQRLRRKNKNQLVCCPPPKLPKLAEGFVSIANLLQCDVMLSLMHTILSRALDLNAKSFTESHLQRLYILLAMDYKRKNQSQGRSSPRLHIWTVKKFKELQPKVSENEMETDRPNEPMTTAEAERREKEKRARLAAERRAKSWRKWQMHRNNFMKSNAELFRQH
ncbi:unnamed protein product [Hermetia illucens]|uniref:E3 ubiquitin-protein ligase n=1 Tax=Hermetia illucens TaxID=343691 RepID=A0A7R8V134_HERIL|nr:unnamed protein product [Hermetia illucens]